MNNQYSIVITTYNGERYIQEQLDSILNQTVLPYEIIVSDDCSHDQTIPILQQYREEYKHIRWQLIKNERNIGYVKNFEEALKLASCEVIFLCDQDDVWMPNKAELILNKFENSNAQVIFTNGTIVNHKLEPTGQTLFEWVTFNNYYQKNFVDYKIGMNIMLTRSIATGATMAIKRGFLKEVLPFPVSNYYVHDSWIATMAICHEALCFIKEPLIYYRIHDSNAIGIKEVKQNNTNKGRSELLIDYLKGRKERESEIYQFLLKRHSVNKSLVFIQKRIELYNQITNQKGFLPKIGSLISFSYYKFKMPNFYTLRMYFGNMFQIIFNK